MRFKLIKVYLLKLMLNSLKEEVGMKTVIVKYDWTPPICQDYEIFGHNKSQCGKNSVSPCKTTEKSDQCAQKDNENGDSFIKVTYKKQE